MDKYLVELRVAGWNLNFDEISSKLALLPTSTGSFAKSPLPDSKRRKEFWSYDGFLETGRKIKEWDRLDEGLICLMEKLWEKRALVRAYKGEFEIFWWCAHFQSSFDGGCTFEPKIIEKLNEFGIALYLNHFFSES